LHSRRSTLNGCHRKAILPLQPTPAKRAALPVICGVSTTAIPPLHGLASGTHRDPLAWSGNPTSTAVDALLIAASCTSPGDRTPKRNEVVPDFVELEVAVPA
jgi:hypothetical protein